MQTHAYIQGLRAWQADAEQYNHLSVLRKNTALQRLRGLHQGRGIPYRNALQVHDNLLLMLSTICVSACGTQVYLQGSAPSHTLVRVCKYANYSLVLHEALQVGSKIDVYLGWVAAFGFHSRGSCRFVNGKLTVPLVFGSGFMHYCL